ncbi:beta-lactamase family protein [Streptomyces sp. NBC_00237]|uniref:serine hydrolase domain-containing protein n=1 Tax=Streptomyces sp. NBC_00237 TaxID=2975687 RepID=UPI0022523472|nr:serine hydrolase domain-containing protein [Streptomyces sp. NBC_00237]MCX5206192.1 beta-lactamase family protein [Streptomyces sp. NBC_00237]
MSLRRPSAVSLAVLTTVVALCAVGVPAQAATGASPGLDRAALREAIALRSDDGAAGIVAGVHRDGDTWRGTSGDAVTGKRVNSGAHFRIGSIGKPMEAVILLQLSAEGRVDLDQSVQHYLPGLLPEDRFKTPVTVRQLLNHTSGLPQDLDGASPVSQDAAIDGRFDSVSFDQSIQQTLHPEGRPGPGPRFGPGTVQEYNSFGYRVAGKLIETLTGHSFHDEVTRRVLKPLGMRDTATSVPGRATSVPRPYLPGYLPRSTGDLVDVNRQGGLPASMTSTAADLDRFITGLFTGRLLRPAQQAELFTVPRGTDGKPLPYAGSSNCNQGPAKGTACYSAVQMYFPLPDGTLLWGKTGSDMGYKAGVFAAPDLNRRAVYAVGTSSADDRAPAIAQRLALAAFTR